MFRNIFLIFQLSIIFISQSNVSTNDATNHVNFNECFINNQKYLFEYIYTSNENNNHNVYTCSLDELDKMNDFERIIWSLIPTSDDSNINEYYIRQKYHQDLYLCATNKFELALQPRYKYHKTSQRFIQSVSIQNKHKLSKIMNECVWSLDQVKKNTYIIRNKFKNETLYAGSQLGKFGKMMRNVYLWPHNVQLNTQTEFRWNIICSNDLFNSRKASQFLSSDMISSDFDLLDD